MSGVTNGTWSRIGDNNLGFGLHRFAHGTGADEQVLWRLQITRNSRDTLISLDATIGDLRDIARWCEKAIELLKDDGGRVGRPEPAPPSRVQAVE